jgi:hypothetical protein
MSRITPLARDRANANERAQESACHLHSSIHMHLDDAIALLSHTPAVLNALLRELPDIWIRTNEGANTMTAVEVIGHLIHAERTNWIPRARTILEFGGTRPFASFDRLGHLREIDGKTVAQLLDEFARLRSVNLSHLRAMKLQPSDLEKRGQHPALGAITLSQLLATWVVHDLTHLHQISRVMAYQYRDAVGPMGSYLGVLKCEGHGAP